MRMMGVVLGSLVGVVLGSLVGVMLIRIDYE